MVSFTLMRESRVADDASIVGHQMKDSFCPHKDLSHFAQLVPCLLRCNTMNSKATTGVIDQMKTLSSFISADDIHKTSRVSYVGADLAITLNEILHTDLYFISYWGIVESVP